MAPIRHFPSYTAARARLRDVLDAAHAGLVTTIARDRERYVVVDADVLRAELGRLLPSQAVVALEGGGCSVFIPGVPVHGDAETFDEAVADLIGALREYAEDWNDELHQAPNHRQHRALVELVELSTDEQLREWLLSSAGGATADVEGPERLVPA